MSGLLDLHVHSTFSDGTHTPAEMVEMAAQRGLAGISLTDHDTMEGIEEAVLSGLSSGVSVIPGVELSTEWQGLDVHVLGYWVLERGDLKSIMDKARCARLKRAVDILERLNSLEELKPTIDLSQVLELAGISPASLGRPHIARAMVELGHVTSEKQAFELYLERGKPAFVPKYRVKPDDAVRAIVAAGGVAVWAHPGRLSFTLLDILMRAGLSGLEAYHPSQPKEVQRELIKTAHTKGLVATGGSDAHSAEFVGECGVDFEVWYQLWSRPR